LIQVDETSWTSPPDTKLSKKKLLDFRSIWAVAILG